MALPIAHLERSGNFLVYKPLTTERMKEKPDTKVGVTPAAEPEAVDVGGSETTEELVCIEDEP